MSYLTFVHGCQIPRGVSPAVRNPGVGSVWQCDECSGVWLLVYVEFPAGNEPANLTWRQLPRGREQLR